ncbi:uncharacterized protein LOC135701788 [Ochlerotatus camptorhynchus]|uniref:uncharacterized protein LOC135701788 n=1 Tax=Ochlerotatus camptorhynchus TaxID=644619 RepID=UPI0031D4825C
MSYRKFSSLKQHIIKKHPITAPDFHHQQQHKQYHQQFDHLQPDNSSCTEENIAPIMGAESANLVDEELEQEEDDLIEEDDSTEYEAGHSISLEKEFDIDLVFRQSAEGLRIMELLRQENSVNSKLIKSITTVLSDYLVRRFGYHPNMHYKDIIARSLVSKYNVLKSSSTAIPHALWFYPHGRGQGKHSGKIHYHIEYMVKKYKQQVHQPRRLGNVDTIDVDDNNMLQASEIQNDSIERLKYIVPTDASLEVIKNDWGQTFGARKIIRDNGDDAKLVDELLEAFPLMIEFSGSLISVDFEVMFPNAGDFNETWEILQPKILAKHHSLHSYIKSRE